MVRIPERSMASVISALSFSVRGTGVLVVFIGIALIGAYMVLN